MVTINLQSHNRPDGQLWLQQPRMSHTHVIEQWAGAEFSEERIEALLEKYRQTYESAAAE